MQIELKNLKVARQLSEETTAYTATVYVDGKPAFHASNHGHGGCDLYHRVDGYTGPSEADINAWLKANHPPYTSEYGTLEYDLELFIGDLIAKQEAKRDLDRLVRSRLVVIVERDGKPSLAQYPTKYKPTEATIAALKAQLAKKGDSAVVVNGDAAAYERALALV